MPHSPSTEDPTLALLRSLLPIGDARFRLELAEPADPRPDVNGDAAAGLRVSLRLSTFEPDGTLSNKIEQEDIVMASREHTGDRDRLAAYLAGWASALFAVVDGVYGGDVDVILPADLVFPQLLADARLQTRAHFYDVFARDHERLRALLDAARDDEFAQFIAHNLGPTDPRVEALSALGERPAIELFIETCALEDCAIGASRLGGEADLPREFEWPYSGEQPLTFVAQVDLAEVRRAVGDAAGALPARGWLYFFFGLQGFDRDAAATRGGGRVLFYDGPAAALARRGAPAGEPWVETLATRAVTFELRRPLPPPYESPFYALLLDDDADAAPERDDVARAAKAFGFLAPLLQPTVGTDEERPRDRLLGYADPLQCDVYMQCDAEAGGSRSGTRRETHARAAQWTLLFQADSDREANVFLGDMGLLYFMIRAEDLAARRFDRVWTVWQSC